MKAAWREYRRMMMSVLGDPKTIAQGAALATILLFFMLVIYSMGELVAWVFS